MDDMMLPAFDAELGFTDLLKPARAERLRRLLSELLGAELAWRLPGEPASAQLADVPLHYEMETVAWLEGAVPAERLAGIAALVEFLFAAEARYLRASAMHGEVVHRDYEALQAEHGLLKASEARYRELAAELEQRVAEQVELIGQARRRLYEAEKLSAVGQLAAGIAHEINNPIGFITSNLRAAKDYLDGIAAFAAALPAWPDVQAEWRRRRLDEDLQDFFALVGEAAEGTKRIARIVSDLKDFSHLDRNRVADVHLNEVIQGMVNVAHHELAAAAQLVLCLADGLPAIHGDGARLGQAFYGLAQNAVQAMAQSSPAGGGVLRIETGLEGGWVVVRFIDNGCGIPPELISRVFEPFFTTKPVGSGTGLGLSVARDSVRAMGGEIDVDSEPGRGTTVRVRFPLSREVRA